MKKTLIAGMAVMMFTAPAFAAGDYVPSDEEVKIVEQQKTEALKVLDDRISVLQDDKACLSAAKTIEDLKNCRQKQRENMISDKFQQRLNKSGIRANQPADAQQDQGQDQSAQPQQ